MFKMWTAWLCMHREAAEAGSQPQKIRKDEKGSKKYVEFILILPNI